MTGRTDDKLWTASLASTRLAAIFRRRHGRRIRWRGRTRPATWICWSETLREQLVLSSWVGPLILFVESNFSGLWTSQTIEAAQRSPLGMCKNTLYKILDRFLWSADLWWSLFFFGQFFRHKSPIAGLACGCRQGDRCVQGRCWCQSRGLQ